MSEIHCKVCSNIVQPTDLFCRTCGSSLKGSSEESLTTNSKSAQTSMDGDQGIETSSEQYAPKSIVPTSGLYHCVLCMLSCDLSKEKGIDPFMIATLYAKQAGMDPARVKEIFAGCREPIYRKRFKASDTFDECPIHQSATGWGLEQKENETPFLEAEVVAPKKKWWPFGKKESEQKAVETKASAQEIIKTRVSAQDIADTWLRYYFDGMKRLANKDKEWIVQKLYDLSLKEPAQAWEIVQLINARDIPDENMCKSIDVIIGGSPLANILYACDDTLWKSILAAADKNQRLCHQLGQIVETSVENAARWKELRQFLDERK